MRQLYISAFKILAFFCFFVVPAMAQKAKDNTPNDNKEYRDLLVKNASFMGIPRQEVAQAIIKDAYKDDITGLTFMYVQQAYQGIKVFNTIVSSAFKNSELQTASGTFVKELSAKAGVQKAAITPIEAVRAAARHLKLNDQGSFKTVADNFSSAKNYKISEGGIARREIDVTLVFVSAEDKQSVKLAWNVSIDVAGSSDWWNVRIDAATGEYLEKNNWTVHENETPVKFGNSLDESFIPGEDHSLHNTVTTNTQTSSSFAPPNVTSATYRVVPFPLESPLYGAFSNVTNPWELTSAGNTNATTHGWHFDGTNNYNFTRGNNVFATLDRNNTNTPEPVNNWADTSSTAVPSLTFINTFDGGVQPFNTVANKKSALDNLFYANNIIHDLTYQYGFTEAAGNFQMDNLGRGGAGNDFVNADAQDANGFSNANFNTPTDGTSGRMQMYTWVSPPTFVVNSPAGIAGTYTAIENSFVAPNKLYQTGPVTGLVAWYNAASSTHNGCAAALDPASLAGKIVLIDGTSCAFALKAKNAQNAGAIAALIYFTTAQGMGGTDATLTIPCLAINTSAANAIIAQLNASVPVTATLTSGIYRDGDFDNGIITHEYGHGVSNRLTGGPSGASCLGHAEQGGEGWSDYLALMLTTNWASATLTDGPNARPIGNYSLSQNTSGVGIRRYPYSTNMAVNPLTYANMATNTQVHAIGEIWCSALWDMTWNVIQQTGSINPNMYNGTNGGGNSIALNLVMTGMKLQNCYPGYIDARDAILAADSILYNGTYRCAIWNAFSRRGMGFSARQGSTFSATDQTVATDLPVRVKISAPSVMQLTPSTQQVFTHRLTCDCGPVNNYVLRDTIPAGFTYISSTPAGATLSGNVLTFPAANFTASEVKNYTVTLQTPAAGCAVDLSINDNREGSTTGGFVSGGTTGWSTSTVRSHTPGSSWFTVSSSAVTNNTLTSAATAASVVNNLSLLSFWHYYRTETTYDGGVVEYSTDGGGTWLDAAPMFLYNPYPVAMDGSSALPGRRSYSGSGKGFNNVMLNLSSLGTTPVQFRFRSATDNGVGVEGWYVDDILRINGCGGFLKTGLYNASNAIADTSFTSVFVTATPLPLRLISFDAKENNGNVSLIWKTAAENNVKDFDVEWSADNINWSKIATVKALNQLSNNYSALHTDPVLGKNYYRLKMNDRDGHTTQSDVRIVNMSKIANRSPVLVPNPVITEGTLYISKYEKNTSVKVYDSKGSLVMNMTVKPGIQQLQINTSRLSTGIYIIEVMGEKRNTIRMMKN